MPKVAKERKFRTTTRPLRATGNSSATNETNSPATKPLTPSSAAKRGPKQAIRSSPAATDAKVSHHDTTPTSLDEKATAIADGSSGTKSTPNGRSKPTTPDPNALSKGQRKRQAKRDQYMRKERMILSSLQVQRAQEQAKRIDGLDALKEALLATVSKPTVTEAPMPKPHKDGPNHSLLQSNRGRKLLLAKELTQMNLVWQHPSYQSDPFATMREHLQNTIVSPAPSVPPTKKRAKSLTVAAPTPAGHKTLVQQRKRKTTKVRATRSKRR